MIFIGIFQYVVKLRVLFSMPRMHVLCHRLIEWSPHEFDLDIRPKNLVKGQVLAKILAESNCKILGINTIMKISTKKNPQEPS